MKLLSESGFIARIEMQAYVRHHKLLLAMVVVLLIPALYVLIYLSSVWDPAAHTPALPVALVNLDRSVEYRGHVFNVGRELLAKLGAKPHFGYREYQDAESARTHVRQGRLAFAVIIPQDFSSNAIPGARAGAGKLEIFVSEGNSYQSAVLARHFAETLGHEVNVSLNEQRWTLVLSDALGSRQGLERLRNAVDQARAGTQELVKAGRQAEAGLSELHNGATRLNQGVVQLVSGNKELGGGLRMLSEKQPASGDLAKLRQGSEAMVAGHVELGRGLTELRHGTGKMRDAVSNFQEEVEDKVSSGDRLADGLWQLSEGLTGLDAGLRSAATANEKLAHGAEQIHAGIGALTNGAGATGSALHQMAGRFPADEKLEQLSAGSNRLEKGTLELLEGVKKIGSGAQHLSGGVELLANALPAPGGSALEGSSPKGLAMSVQPRVEIAAPVLNNGIAFAPNVIPAALWLGAGIAAFLIYVRQQPGQAVDFSRSGRLLGKWLFPAALSLLQAVLVLLLVLFVLKIPVVHLLPFVLTLAVASLTFITIVFALTRVLGDAGKALSLLFLAVQLSSSGGILPVELSGPMFKDISPWLPLTWVVRAIKASMFDAYDGAWQLPLLYVALAGVLAAVMACFLGRWRYVEIADMRPPLDL